VIRAAPALPMNHLKSLDKSSRLRAPSPHTHRHFFDSIFSQLARMSPPSCFQPGLAIFCTGYFLTKNFQSSQKTSAIFYNLSMLVTSDMRHIFDDTNPSALASPAPRKWHRVSRRPGQFPGYGYSVAHLHPPAPPRRSSSRSTARSGRGRP